MDTRRAPWFGPTVITLLFCASIPAHAEGPNAVPSTLRFANGSGVAATYSIAGDIDLGNPFFQSLGSNGRSCVTCHQPSDAWSVTPAHLRARFDASDGTDPIFRLNDGAVSPLADVSTAEARRSA